MIIDMIGIVLTPGNNGDNCLGNGEHFDEGGNLIECCCDECEFYLCCMGYFCENCKDRVCEKEASDNSSCELPF